MAALVRRLRPAQADAGFGLIEMAMAFIVLMLTIVPLSYALTNLMQQAATGTQRIAANEVAEAWLEQLANQPVTASQVGTSVPPCPVGSGPCNPGSTVGNITYSVTTQLQFVATSGQSLCLVGSVPQVLGAVVRVTWGSNNSVTDATEFNPTSQVVNPADGFVAMPIYGDDVADTAGMSYGQRIQQVPVTVTGPSPLPNTETVYPDNTGCVFIELAAGTYNISLNQPGSLPPFIDFPVGNTTSQVVSVSADETTIAPGLYFDEGSTIQPVTNPADTVVEDGVACLAGGSACATGGESQSGATLFAGSATSWSQVTLPASVTRLDAESCVSATSCFAVGDAGGPAVVAYDPTGPSAGLAVPLVAGAAQLSSIACTANSPNACIATGLDPTGAPVFVAYAGASPAWATSASPFPTGATGIATVTAEGCATVSCVVVGTNSSGVPVSVIFDIASNTMGASAVSFPASVVSVNALGCNDTECVAAGTDSSGNPVSIDYTDASENWSNSTKNFPGAFQTISEVTCTSDECFALGATAAGSPRTTSRPAANWTAAKKFPAGVVSVTQMTCPDDTDCFAIGDAGNSSTVLGDSGAGWSELLPASVTAPTFLSGIGCFDSSDCYVAAVDSSGNPEMLVDQAGTWTAVGLPGSYTVNTAAVSQIDLEPASGAPLVSEPVTPADLYYPNPTGYVLWAGSGAGGGSCAKSPPSWQTPVLVVPGGATSASPPMGLLAVEAVDTATGAPLAGASITATRTSCTGEGNIWPASLTTGADGIAVIAAPPGTYSVTVSLGVQNGSGTVAVGQIGTFSPVAVAD